MEAPLRPGEPRRSPRDQPRGAPKRTKGRRAAAAAGCGAADGANGSAAPGVPPHPGLCNRNRGGPVTSPFQRQYRTSRGCARAGGGMLRPPWSKEEWGKPCACGPGPVGVHRPDTAPAPPVPPGHSTEVNREINFFLSPSSGICRRANSYSLLAPRLQVCRDSQVAEQRRDLPLHGPSPRGASGVSMAERGGPGIPGKRRSGQSIACPSASPRGRRGAAGTPASPEPALSLVLGPSRETPGPAATCQAWAGNSETPREGRHPVPLCLPAPCCRWSGTTLALITPSS